MIESLHNLILAKEQMETLPELMITLVMDLSTMIDTDTLYL